MSDCPTRLIARAVASARTEDIPDAVMRHALRTFVNFVGCAVGGSRHEMAERTEQAMLPLAANGECRVIGRPTRTTAVTAALLNGIVGAVNAFDDTHAEAIIHPGPPVGAALVAISGAIARPVRGDAFLLACCWGLEIACRLSKAISVAPAAGPMGWSQTGVGGTAAAAAACANLLGLDEERTLWAIGTAASLSSGLRVAHGSMAMHLAPAQAAATGVQSALLAQAGVTGPTAAIEGRYGFFELFADTASMDHLLSGLGTRFELLDNTFKAYPAGIVIQAVIDACLALRPAEGLAPEQIVAVLLEVPSVTAALTDRPNPSGLFEAQVSSQHWAAATLLQGAAGLEQAQLSTIEDPAVAQVRSRCRMIERPDLDADAAIVSVELADGRRLQAKIDHYLGSLARPLDDDGVSRKFLSQAIPLMGEPEARALLDRCWGIPRRPDVRSIW